jgi:transposase
VQANRVRQFARAAGILAETDRIDARVLCGFGAAMRPTLSASNLEEQLRELESQRRHLTHLLVMERNRDARLSDLSIRTLNRRLIQQIQRQIEKVDLLIKNQIERSQELSAAAQKLTAITEWALLLCSRPKCQSLGDSILAKLQRWLESRLLIATVENSVAKVPSIAGAGRCAMDFTWARCHGATQPNLACLLSAIARSRQASQGCSYSDDAKTLDRAQQRSQTGANLCLKPRHSY